MLCCTHKEISALSTSKRLLCGPFTHTCHNSPPERLGIIGEQLSEYDPCNLKPRKHIHHEDKGDDDTYIHHEDKGDDRHEDKGDGTDKLDEEREEADQ